jgi:hypothetical protein
LTAPTRIVNVTRLARRRDPRQPVKKNNKILLFFLLVLTVLSGAGEAGATIAGVVGGCVRMKEARGQLTDAAGSLHRADTVDADGSIPVPEVLIRFTFSGAGGPEQKIDPVFVRADADGCYSARWTDWTRDAFPARAHMAILWSHTDAAGQRDHMPPSVFSVHGPTGQALGSARSVDLMADTIIDRTFDGGDAAATYVTAWEFFDRVVRGGNGGRSALLVNAMRDIHILIGLPNVSGGWGFAPTGNEILVAARTPVLTPWTVAHELGHLVTWNALGLRVAPLLPTDYVGLTWDFFTRESERAAFLEGMASFFAMAWMWERTAAAPTLYRGATRFDFEAATGTGQDPTTMPFACATVPSGWERPFCNAAALWDVFDAPADDDDPMTTRTQADIVATLDGYPDACPPAAANGCTNELGPGGLNHNDFLRNFRPAGARGKLSAIYKANGLHGGVP